MANDALIQGRIGVDLSGPIKEAPSGYRVIFDFTAGADCAADLSYLSEQGFISGWQSMYVDNSNNAADVAFTFAGSDQLIIVKAGVQKYINILTSTPMSVNAHSTGNVRVTVFFLNFEVQNSVDLESITAIISGTVTVTGAVTISPTIGDGADVGGTLAAGGVAQQFMAANAIRKSWTLQNQSSGNLWVRSRGAGGLTDATQNFHSLIIPPGFLYEPPIVSLNAFSIIGATTGQTFWARDYS